jgi:DNA-directed RNA polymerase specialized sigma24 family protein
MAGTATDEQLIEHASSGDGDAVAELVERHRDAMLLEARVLVGEERAEQVVHTALTNALQAIVDGFRPFALEPWLAMMTREAAEGRQTSAAAVIAADLPANAPISDDDEVQLLTAGLHWLPSKEGTEDDAAGTARRPAVSPNGATTELATGGLAAAASLTFAERARASLSRRPRTFSEFLTEARELRGWGAVGVAGTGLAAVALVGIVIAAAGGPDSAKRTDPLAAVSGSASSEGRGGGSAGGAADTDRSASEDKGKKDTGGGGSTRLASTTAGDGQGAAAGGAAGSSTAGGPATTTTTASAPSSSSTGGGSGGGSSSSTSSGGGGSVSGTFGPSGSSGPTGSGSTSPPAPAPAPAPSPPPTSGGSGSDQPQPAPSDPEPSCSGPISCTIGGIGGGGN